MQYYLFPKGIRYNRKTDSVRTEKYNSLFLWIARKQQEVGENKNGIPELNLSYAALVAPEIQNPNVLLEDTRVLAQIWELYGYNAVNL